MASNSAVVVMFNEQQVKNLYTIKQNEWLS